MSTPKCDNSAWKNFLRHVPMIVKYIKDPENLPPLDRYVILGAYRAGISGANPNKYVYDIENQSLNRGAMIIFAWGCGLDLRDELIRFGYLKPWRNE